MPITLDTGGASGSGSGTGDMLASNNLSDLTNKPTALTNLGGTTVGKALFKLVNPSAITFLRLNVDNTVSALSDTDFRTAIGAGTSSFNGAYSSLSGKPTLGTAASLDIGGGGAANQLPYFPTSPAITTGLIGNAGGGVVYAVSLSSELNLNANTLGITAASVTNAMLAGSIAASKISGTAAVLTGNTFTGLLQFSGTAHAGIKLNNLTTAQKNALTASAGMAVFDTDLARLQVYNGSAWKSMVRLDGDTMTSALTVSAGTNSATPTDGLLLTNSTAAIAGTQSTSPKITWTGQGWKTNSTAASQSVAFNAFALPVQGNANPTAKWTLQKSINNEAAADVLTLLGSSGSGDTTMTIGSSNCALSIQTVVNNSATLSCNGGGIFFNAGGNAMYWGGTYLGLRAADSLAWSSDGSSNNTGSNKDLYLSRAASATLQLGILHATTPTTQTLKAHDVTTGTGADLCFNNGKGSVSGGAIKLAVSTTNGAAAVIVTVKASGVVNIANLPTSASGLSTGDLWNNSGVLAVA